MEKILLWPVFLGFILTLISMPWWIKKTHQIGLVWEDMHKRGFPKNVSGSGGIIVMFGFLGGVLFYVFLNNFFIKSSSENLVIFTVLITILISAIIGFLDDILGWAKGGLSVRIRLILLLFSAIPLMVINSGVSTISIPFFSTVDVGLIYPLFFIPIGIVGATATFNFLAGYNGLEASQGIIILSSLSIVTYLTGNIWLMVILLIMVASLISFYVFNINPAKVFPGDVLTYPVGVMIAITAILGNIERICVFFFIPYILETCLKLRGGLKKQSFGKINEEGFLEEPYDKIYGLEHLSIRILKKLKSKVREQDVVYLINVFQLGVIIIGLIIFRRGIF